MKLLKMTKKQIIIGLITISFLGIFSLFSYQSGYKSGYNNAVVKTTNDLATQFNNSCNEFIKNTTIPELTEHLKNTCIQFVSTLRCPVSQQTFQQFRIEYKTNQLLDKLLYP
jgi:hypothetical protein